MKTVGVIALKAARLGERIYCAGDTASWPADRIPEGFTPLKVEGPNGIIKRGPFYFALRSTCHGKPYAVGDLRGKPNVPAPADFAPLTDKKLYELVDEGNGVKAYHLNKELCHA